MSRSFWKRKISTFALASAALTAVCLPAHAGVVYSTGFEGPTYTTGPVTGQDGWQEFGSAIEAVQTFNVFSGAQALFLDSSTAGQSGPYHNDAMVGPLISLSAELYLASSSTQSEWQFAGLGPGLAPFLGGVNILPDDTIQLITSGFPTFGTFTRNSWHNVAFLFDITSQTYDFFLDGSLLASSAAFCGDNGPCLGANVPTYGATLFDVFGDVGHNDSAFLDDVLVTDTPEPGSLLLFASGVALLVTRRMKRT